MILLEHNITIANPEVPVLNVGTKENPSYLPAQVCEVLPGQAASAKLSSGQTDQIRGFAVRRPNENEESIVASGPRLLGLNPTNQTLVSVIFPPGPIHANGSSANVRDGHSAQTDGCSGSDSTESEREICRKKRQP